MRVLVTHNVEDLEAYYGRSLPQLRSLAEVVTNPGDQNFTTSQLVEAAAGCDVIVSHRGTPFPAQVFAALPDLVAVFRCAVDISDIDVDAATAHGVLVGRAAKSFVPSTAELALGLLIDLSRGITDSTVEYRSGREPAQRPGVQLRGRTAGILGFGAIGSYLAELLDAVGMRVMVHDPSADVPADLVATFGEVLSESDVVFPLAQASPATENLIDGAALAAIKPGALLINVSRGELLDEDAVLDALDSGRLGGLAMDVGRAPDQRPSHALASRPGVVATPHLGGLTPDNADAQAASSVDQIAAMLAGELPPRAVNADAAYRFLAFIEAHG